MFQINSSFFLFIFFTLRNNRFLANYIQRHSDLLADKINLRIFILFKVLFYVNLNLNLSKYLNIIVMIVMTMQILFH